MKRFTAFIVALLLAASAAYAIDARIVGGDSSNPGPVRILRQDNTQSATVSVGTSATDIISITTGVYGWSTMACEIDNATNALTAFTTHVQATATSSFSAAMASAAADYTTAPKAIVKQCEASPVTLGATTKTTCIFNTAGVYAIKFQGTKGTAGNTTIRCFGSGLGSTL